MKHARLSSVNELQEAYTQLVGVEANLVTGAAVAFVDTSTFPWHYRDIVNTNLLGMW